MSSGEWSVHCLINSESQELSWLSKCVWLKMNQYIDTDKLIRFTGETTETSLVDVPGIILYLWRPTYGSVVIMYAGGVTWLCSRPSYFWIFPELQLDWESRACWSWPSREWLHLESKYAAMENIDYIRNCIGRFSCSKLTLIIELWRRHWASSHMPSNYHLHNPSSLVWKFFKFLSRVSKKCV